MKHIEIDDTVGTMNVVSTDGFDETKTGVAIEGGWVQSDLVEPAEFKLNGRVLIRLDVAGHRPSIPALHSDLGWLVLIHTVNGVVLDIPKYEVWSDRDFDHTDGPISSSDLTALIVAGIEAAEATSANRQRARFTRLHPAGEPVESLGSLLHD